MRVQLAKIISQALIILNMIGQNRSDITEAHLSSSPRYPIEALDNMVKQVCEHTKKFKVCDVIVILLCGLLLWNHCVDSIWTHSETPCGFTVDSLWTSCGFAVESL